ncbi:hypothetical protein FQZ97_914440 [compost metagenome]
MQLLARAVGGEHHVVAVVVAAGLHREVHLLRAAFRGGGFEFVAGGVRLAAVREARDPLRGAGVDVLDEGGRATATAGGPGDAVARLDHHLLPRPHAVRARAIGGGHAACDFDGELQLGRCGRRGCRRRNESDRQPAATAAAAAASSTAASGQPQDHCRGKRGSDVCPHVSLVLCMDFLCASGGAERRHECNESFEFITKSSRKSGQRATAFAAVSTLARKS